MKYKLALIAKAITDILRQEMSPDTFDLFVVGAQNHFAYAASLAVAKNPAKTYNPLFIHGGVGVGKTHLMRAIGRQVVVNHEGAKVIYASMEESKLVERSSQYRKADVLLLDDIHLLAGRESAQEEFFHTFNTFFDDARKQIVLSSIRPPTEILNLDRRLVTRFESGLVAELKPPGIETRMAILRLKAELLKVELDDTILEFLARRIRSNVRWIEGALLRVAAFSMLSGREVTLEAMEHLLRDILQKETKSDVSISKALDGLKGKPRITFDE